MSAYTLPAVGLWKCSMVVEVRRQPQKVDERVLRKVPRRVECVAYAISGGRYRAICLDFSLIAESEESLFDAVRHLQAQIESYVDDMVEQGCPDHLVNRGLSFWERLPLRLMLAAYSLLGSCRNLLNKESDSATWRQPVPYGLA